jgi:hypothetical protein
LEPFHTVSPPKERLKKIRLKFLYFIPSAKNFTKNNFYFLFLPAAFVDQARAVLPGRNHA